MSYAFIGGEPIEQRDAVVSIVEQVLRTLDVEPREIWCTQQSGKVARDRAFTWERFLESAETMATIYGYGIRRSNALFFLHVSLRHGARSYAVAKYAPPALSFAVEVGERMPAERAIAAAELLLRQAARSLPVLSGGLTCFEQSDAASAEVTFVSAAPERQPESARRRQSLDQSLEGRLWKKARRVYWETLLGPALAAKLGGAEAARAAGAASVEEIDGSLLVHAGGPIRARRCAVVSRTHDWPAHVAVAALDPEPRRQPGGRVTCTP